MMAQWLVSFECAAGVLRGGFEFCYDGMRSECAAGVLRGGERAEAEADGGHGGQPRLRRRAGRLPLGHARPRLLQARPEADICI